MNQFWSILLEINLLVTLVWLGYEAMLKNITFFRWTRLYLVIGMVVSLLYPVVKPRGKVFVQEGVALVIPDLSHLSENAGIDYGLWAGYAIATTFAILFLRLLFRLYSLYRIHRASIAASFQGTSYRDTLREVNPFSFWKWIYLHRNSHSEKELLQIMAHEQIHIRERHTFDVLLAEVCTVICWYNPASKRLARAVRDNLEYLVDAQVLQSGVDRISYQHSLVGISLNRLPAPYHTSPFAFQTLKKRITMMNKRPSSKAKLISYALLTPLVLAVATFSSVSCQKEALDEIRLKQQDEIVLIAKGQQKEVEGVRLRGEKRKMDHVLILVDGKETKDLSSINPADIQSIHVLKYSEETLQYGTKARDGLIKITTKSR